MNKLQRRKLKRSADMKLMFFTFFGAFILFFGAFTYLLPMVTPKVEIPALTQDHVFNAITSHDFRGRIDPRLHSIELQEEVGQQVVSEKKEKDSPTPVSALKDNEVVNDDSVSNKEILNPEKNTKKSSNEEIPLPGQQEKISDDKKKVSSANLNVPPRPRPNVVNGTAEIAPPVPVFQAQVVVGDFSTSKEAQVASDILSSLDFEPFMREKSGKYFLQVASFSDYKKAESLVKELKNRNFDAKIIYE